MEAEMLQRLGPHPHIVTQPWLVWWQVADVDMDDFVDVCPKNDLREWVGQKDPPAEQSQTPTEEDMVWL